LKIQASNPGFGIEEEVNNKRNLTGRITDIDEYGLVTIMFNHKLDNSKFNITNKTMSVRRPRFLELNLTSI
jgi:hypothetical protein